MSKKYHFDDSHIIGKHTTASDAGSEVIKNIRKLCPDVDIKLGVIRRGGKSSGEIHVKAVETIGGIHLLVSARGAIQHIYLVKLGDTCKKQEIIGLLVSIYGHKSVVWESLMIQRLRDYLATREIALSQEE